MPKVSKVTKKGQVTIPVDMREELGLNSGQKVFFIRKGSKLEIEPVPDFLDLKGSISTQKEYSKEKARKAIKKNLSEKYEKENS
ncbi:MAG: AbrB/MazE/SpoVT family DNA-binding domain-containing protein [Candidatus Magasanikbacteria bacterium]